MDLVSKMLENIITAELPDPDEPSSAQANIAERRTSGSSAEHPDPALATQTVQSPQYSSFWYLDDDPLKAPNQISEKVMEKLISLVIKPETQPSPGLEERMEIHRQRPPFSMNLMVTNSTQLAQKTSPMFEVFDTAIMIFGWYNPFCTVGLVMLVTHAILNPYLVGAFPSFLLLKKFLVPSYLRLFPPDSSLVDGLYILRNPIPYDGLPLDKYEPPKVISQYSREFLMNFADLQNFQVGYIRMYDALVDWGQHYFLFEDQKLSTVVYLGVLVAAIANVVLMPYLVPLLVAYLPLKFLSVTSVWCVVGMCHPLIKDKILDRFHTEDARLRRLDRTDKLENLLMRLVGEDTVTDHTRQVEIFELQKLDSDNIWAPVGFADTFYGLNHPSRVVSISEDLSEGECSDEEGEKEHDQTTLDEQIDDENADLHFRRKATLAEIKPPRNWVFSDVRWCIDLEPMVWVNDNCVMDLVSVDADEKWVYDFVDGGESPDGHIYRRRRWVRECKRENVAARRKRDSVVRPVSTGQSEWFSKTLTNLSQTVG